MPGLCLCARGGGRALSGRADTLLRVSLWKLRKCSLIKGSFVNCLTRDAAPFSSKFYPPSHLSSRCVTLSFHPGAHPLFCTTFSRYATKNRLFRALFGLKNAHTHSKCAYTLCIFAHIQIHVQSSNTLILKSPCGKTTSLTQRFKFTSGKHYCIISKQRRNL